MLFLVFNKYFPKALAITAVLNKRWNSNDFILTPKVLVCVKCSFIGDKTSGAGIRIAELEGQEPSSYCLSKK